MTSGGTTTPGPPGAPFRPYCDLCGIKFEEGQLRPLSKFCMYCGDPLLDWIKRRLSSTAFAPPTPEVTPATQRQINVAPRNNDEDEIFSGDSVRGGRRGRGGGITSGRRRDKRRASVTGGEREVAPVTPVRNQEAEYGRGLRASRRLDYSMQNYYRGALGGVPGTGIVSSGHKRRRLEVTALGSPVMVLSYDSNDSWKKDEIIVANGEPSPNSGETVEDPPIPTDLQRDLDTPVRQFGPSPTARRSRPFREGRGRGAPLRALSTPSRHTEELDSSDDETHNTLSTDSLHDEPTAIPLPEINLEAFNLPPVIDVPRGCLEPVGRPSSLKDFRIWTVHSYHHEYVPHRAGEHGILYVNRGDIPKYLDHHNFGLMAMYENMDRNKWYYLGQYKIAKLFTMALSQWERVSEEVKARKTNKYLVRGCAREWCKAQKVNPERGFRDAVDQGRWKFDCLVIQCIAFNRQVWRTLREVNTEASGRASADE